MWLRLHGQMRPRPRSPARPRSGRGTASAGWRRVQISRPSASLAPASEALPEVEDTSAGAALGPPARLVGKAAAAAVPPRVERCARPETLQLLRAAGIDVATLPEPHLICNRWLRIPLRRNHRDFARVRDMVAAHGLPEFGSLVAIHCSTPQGVEGIVRTGRILPGPASAGWGGAVQP